MSTHTFSAELWRHSGPDAWHFIRLPVGTAEEIRETTVRRGFGSVRVRATIGSTTWDTSVFPDAKSGSYLLPVKAAVRRAEDVEDGDTPTVTIAVRD